MATLGNLIDLTGVCNALIALCAAACARYAVPWLREKLGAEKTARLTVWAAIAVRAAEQLYGGGQGENKFAYARDFLVSRGFHVDMDAIQAAIENAVFAMNEAETDLDFYDIQEGP